MIKSILHAFAGIGLLLAPAQAAEEYFYSPPVSIGGNTWQGLNSNYLAHKMVVDTGLKTRTVFYTKKTTIGSMVGGKWVEKSQPDEEGFMTANCRLGTLNGKTVDPNGSTLAMQDAHRWKTICNLGKATSSGM